MAHGEFYHVPFLFYYHDIPNMDIFSIINVTDALIKGVHFRQSGFPKNYRNILSIIQLNYVLRVDKIVPSTN